MTDPAVDFTTSDPIEWPQPANAPPAKLFAALAKAQAAFPVIPKSKKGHGYNYAPLEAVIKATRPALAKNELGFTQSVIDMAVVTTLFHSSGETLKTSFPMLEINQQGRKSMLNPMQEAGAKSTYAARYGLCLALGISADEDTDASEKGSAGAPVTEDFRDTRHDDMNTGVKGVNVDKDATPAEKAKAYADGLVDQIQCAKTLQGLSGVMSRNEAIMDRLHESYEADHANVIAAYDARFNALQEEE